MTESIYEKVKNFHAFNCLIINEERESKLYLPFFLQISLTSIFSKNVKIWFCYVTVTQCSSCHVHSVVWLFKLVRILRPQNQSGNTEYKTFINKTQARSAQNTVEQILRHDDVIRQLVHL